MIPEFFFRDVNALFLIEFERLNLRIRFHLNFECQLYTVNILMKLEIPLPSTQSSADSY